MLDQISICKCQNDSLCFHLTNGGAQSQGVHVGHIVRLTEITSGLEYSLLPAGLWIELHVFRAVPAIF